MTHASATVAIPAAPIFGVRDPALALAGAARLLLPHLERGQRIDAATLRGAMNRFWRVRRHRRLELEDRL